MDTGADAEILNLLDLPTVAPDIWKIKALTQKGAMFHTQQY